MPAGDTWEGQGRVQAERCRTWVHAFIRVPGWSALGFLDKGRICQFILKKWVLVSFVGALPKGHTRRRHQEVEENPYHVCLGNHIANLHSLVTLQAAI